MLDAHIHVTFLLIKTRFGTSDASCSVAEISSVKGTQGWREVGRDFTPKGDFSMGSSSSDTDYRIQTSLIDIGSKPEMQVIRGQETRI